MSNYTPSQPRAYGKTAKKGIAWGVLREWGSYFLIIPSTVVLARLLSPQEFGVAAAAYFFQQLASRLTQFGFGMALMRVKTMTDEHVSSVFVTNLLLASLAWATLFLGAGAIGTFFASPESARVLRVASFGFFIMALGSVPTALLSREMRYRETAASEWMATLTNTVAAVVLAWIGFSYWSLVYAHLAADAVRTLTRMWMVRWRPSFRFSRAAMHELFSFGAGLYVKNLLEYAGNNVDNLIVGRMLGISALGLYDKAFSTVGKIAGRFNLAGPTLFRVFALIHEEPERFRRAYRKVVLTVTVLGYPVLTGMAIVAPELVEVMFGMQWMGAVVPLQILCVSAMLRLLNTYASTAMQATGLIWPEVKRLTFFAASVAVAVTVMSHRWGIEGAAGGVLLATAGMTILLQALLHRTTAMTWREMLSPQVPAIVCALGLAAVVLSLRHGMRLLVPGIDAWLLLSLATVIGGAYYLAFFLLSGFQEVREVALDSMKDLAPALAKRLGSIRGSRAAVRALPQR